MCVRHLVWNAFCVVQMSKIYNMEEGRDANFTIPTSTSPSSTGGSGSSGSSGGGDHMNGSGELLSAVSCAEDKLLIIDILNAIRMCRHPHGQLCTSWSVHPTSTGYILTAYLPKPVSSSPTCSTVEVTHDDLSMIESVNLLRVRVGVAHLNADTWALRVHITSHKSPVSFTVHDTLRFTQRKSLIWGSSSSSGIGNTQNGMASTVVDHGKSLFKNIFSKGEHRFSISRDNTNPSGAGYCENDASVVPASSARKRRERDEPT